jgi:hypothetical protein
MPLFFLNIHDKLGFAQDEEGVELPSLEAARAKAIEGIRSLLSDDVKHGRLDFGGRIEVVDDQSGLLTTIHFEEAVEISRNRTDCI